MKRLRVLCVCCTRHARARQALVLDKDSVDILMCKELRAAQVAAAAEAAAAVEEARRAVELAASAAELQRHGADLQARAACSTCHHLRWDTHSSLLHGLPSTTPAVCEPASVCTQHGVSSTRSPHARAKHAVDHPGSPVTQPSARSAAWQTRRPPRGARRRTTRASCASATRPPRPRQPTRRRARRSARACPPRWRPLRRRCAARCALTGVHPIPNPATLRCTHRHYILHACMHHMLPRRM